jgi:hypothetical protein
MRAVAAQEARSDLGNLLHCLQLQNPGCTRAALWRHSLAAGDHAQLLVIALLAGLLEALLDAAGRGARNFDWPRWGVTAANDWWRHTVRLD